MKSIIVSLLFAFSCWSATLEWDRNQEPEVGRYNVWIDGTNGVQLLGTTTNTVFVGTNFTTRSRLGVSAVSTNGFESEIAWGDNPGKPLRIRLTVQSSDNPTGPWTDQTNTVLVAALSASGFVRGKMEIER